MVFSIQGETLFHPYILYTIYQILALYLTADLEYEILRTVRPRSLEFPTLLPTPVFM